MGRIQALREALWLPGASYLTCQEQLPLALPAGPILCGSLKTFLQKPPTHLAPNPQATIGPDKVDENVGRRPAEVGRWGGAGMTQLWEQIEARTSLGEGRAVQKL